MMNQEACFRRLLEEGADLEAKDESGTSVQDLIHMLNRQKLLEPPQKSPTPTDSWHTGPEIPEGSNNGEISED